MKLNWSEIWRRHIVKKASCCGVQLEDLQKKYEEQRIDDTLMDIVPQKEQEKDSENFVPGTS